MGRALGAAWQRRGLTEVSKEEESLDEEGRLREEVVDQAEVLPLQSCGEVNIAFHSEHS